MESVIEDMTRRMEELKEETRQAEQAQEQTAQEQTVTAQTNGQVENKPKRKERFCLQEKIYRGVPHPCSPEEYIKVADGGDNEVWDIWNKIQLLKLEYPQGGDDYDQEYNLLKRELPVACFHAQEYVNDSRRTNENAYPSGLAIGDYDHCDGRKIWADMVARNVVEENKIVLAYITPSGGLRLVAERFWNESIPMTQKRLAQAANAEYDPCVCDLARASYITPKILFIDIAGLTFASEEEAKRIGDHFCEMDKGTRNPRGTWNDGCNCYNNSYDLGVTAVILEMKDEKEIVPTVQVLVDALTVGGTPKIGMRHDTYNTLAAYVAPLVDFEPDRLFAVLPSWKDADERRAQCKYACEHADRYGRTPLLVTIAQEKAKLNNKVIVNN